MATPEYFLDDDSKSITILAQNPKKSLSVIESLIKDGIIAPDEFDKVYFDFPCDIAPLEIESTTTKKKYKTIYIISGYVANRTYVTFTFENALGTDTIYNANYVFRILNRLGIKLTDDMKRILRDEKRICDKNGFYKARLYVGDCLKVRENNGNEIIEVGY